MSDVGNTNMIVFI